MSYIQQDKAPSRYILVISALEYWSMGDGKGGPALYKTLIGYAEHGWEVFFITGNRVQGPSSYLLDTIHVIRFDAPWLKHLSQIRKLGFFVKIVWWLWFQWMSFIKAQQLHAKHEFDVVYGYEISGVPVAKVLSKLWHIPMVSRFQGTILVQAMKRHFGKLRNWEHVLGLSIPADLVIMTNDGTQGDRVLKRLGVNMDKVKFWMNGIDLTAFDKMPEKQEAKKNLNVNSKYILLTVSRLVAWKRVERSISALPDIIKDLPDTNLIIVGDGPEIDNLKLLVCKLKVERYVHFEGAVPHEEISKYFAAADIFLSFYDLSNVGNPLLEAMISGKCSVTLNNGDTRKFIHNRHNGILIEYEDIVKIPHVVKDLLADDKRRKKLGSNAMKFAKEHFWTWEERMDAENKVVENLIK